MKKFLALFLALIMAFAVGMTVFAEPGNFVQSPSANEGPELIEGENEDEDCEAILVITPYRDRDTLPEKALSDMEYVYNLIASGVDLTTLCAEFKAFVESLGLTGDDLAVSDLFDISYYSCEEHEDHGYFRIRLSEDALENFVGLLHYNNGKWEFIDNAKVLEDGKTLEFRVKDFSPFAVVVDTSAGSAVSPETGYQNYAVFAVVILSVAVLGIAGISLKKKKYE